VRDVATAAGISKSTAAEHLQWLAEQGFIDRARRQASVVRRRDLLDRWLAAYADTVRRAWLVGTYRSQIRDPEELAQLIEREWGEQVWAFGGGAAAWRMKQFYRGEDTVLHVDHLAADSLRRIRAIAADDGPITVLRTPGTVAYEGAGPHLAHPLLVYTEMMTARDPRMREGATEIRDRLLGDHA
jgi:hypothetical protein